MVQPSKSLPTDKLGFRIDEACRAIGIGRTALYALMSKGTIRSVKVAGRTIIPRAELERLLWDPKE